MATKFYLFNKNTITKDYLLTTGMTDEMMSSLTTTTVTDGNLEMNTCYAYKGGTILKSDGTKSTTFELIVCFWFGRASESNKTARFYTAPFIRRTDSKSSTIGCKDFVTVVSGSSISNNSSTKTIWTSSTNQTFSNSWHLPHTNKTDGTVDKTAKKDTGYSYDSSGNASMTMKFTGTSNASTFNSIDCTFSVQAPKMVTATAATLSISPTSIEFGSSSGVTITQDHTSGIMTDIMISFAGESDVYNDQIATGNTSTTSFNYKPALSVAATYLKTLSSVVATVSCSSSTTSGTFLDTKQYKLTLQVPINNKCNISSITERNTPSDGYKIGRDIPSVTVNINTSQAAGAYATKLVVNFGTESITINSPSTSQVVTGTKTITSTTQTITATVTDSRGRTSSKSIQLNSSTLDLAKTITVLTASRTGSSAGTASGSIDSNNNGANCRVRYTAVSEKIKYEIANGGSYNRSMTVMVFYKKVGNSSFSFYSNYTTPTNTSGIVSDDFVLPINDAENPYIIKIGVYENGDTSSIIYRETNLSSGFILFDLYNNGRGLSIGCAAENGNFCVGIPARFYSSVYAASGVDTTSDERKKNTINPLSDLFTEDILLKVFKNLDPVSFKYNDQKDNLIHFGFLANRLKEIMDNNEIASSDYSIVKEVQEPILDKITGKIKKETTLTMSYDELIPILFLMIKILLRELNSINNRVEILEEGIKNGKNN